MSHSGLACLLLISLWSLGAAPGLLVAVRRRRGDVYRHPGFGVSGGLAVSRELQETLRSARHDWLAHVVDTRGPSGPFSHVRAGSGGSGKMAHSRLQATTIHLDQVAMMAAAAAACHDVHMALHAWGVSLPGAPC